MKIIYRPEINGLRAVAVIAVILYHAKITIFDYKIFTGGFIGVDIFFVISGYLITSIIFKELVMTGSFSFKHFYERRIRRILPLLLVVMLVSLPFAWMYLLPSSLIDFSKSILYSLGFSSNFYFHYSGQQYGAESGLLKPFLHTWSLSAEEQYYIFFPVVMLIIFKYFKKYLLTTLFVGFFISLIMADWGSRNYTSSTFYFLHTRIWELLAGSILAYFEIKLGHRSKNKTLNLVFPGIGLFLIGNCFLFFDDKIFHPSFYTLLPIIGICLIIWFSDNDELITKILSSKLFVGIGLISYSLYLWHYPIFAFYRVNEFNQETVFKKLFLVIVILVLSIVSYYFIERPARNKKNKFKIIIISIIISIFFLIIYNFNVIQKYGFQDRIPEILQKNLTKKENWNVLKNSEGRICHNNIEGCKFNTSSNKKVYTIGDSHISVLNFNLKDRFIENNYQFISFAFSACLYFPGFNYVTLKTQAVDNSCNSQYFEKLKHILLKEKDSIIIFGGRFPVYLTNYFFDNQEGGSEGQEISGKFVAIGKYDTIQDSFKNEVLQLSNNNKIILLYPIPEAGWNVPNKLNIFLKKFSKNVNEEKLTISDFITTSYEVYKNRTKSSFELLDSIQGDNIFRVYPHKLFCDTIIKDRCINHDEKNIFYADDDHPSFKGAQMINDLIMMEIKKME